MTAPTNQEFVSGTTITSQWLNGVNDAINNSTQEITGSRPRTLPEKVSDAVSIKDFGAMGNGIKDDTTAIYTALSSNQVIFFPKGTYKITQSIDVSAAWCIISDNATILYDGPSGVNYVIANTPTGDCVIKGSLTINGQSKAHKGIYISNNTDIFYTFESYRLACINFYKSNISYTADGVWLEGAFSVVKFIDYYAKNIVLGTGAGNPGISGVRGATVKATSNTRLPKKVEFIRAYIEDVYSEDLTYSYDQDGLGIFSPEDTAMTDTMPDTGMDILVDGCTFINTIGRAVKIQAQKGIISNSMVELSREVNHTTFGTAFDFQTGGGTAVNLTAIYRSSAIHANTVILNSPQTSGLYPLMGSVRNIKVLISDDATTPVGCVVRLGSRTTDPQAYCVSDITARGPITALVELRPTAGTLMNVIAENLRGNPTTGFVYGIASVPATGSIVRISGVVRTEGSVAPSWAYSTTSIRDAVTAYETDLIQTSTLDQTSGALLRVGAFGLGSSVLSVWPTSDLLDTTGVGNGWYYTAAASNRPTSTGTSAWIVQYIRYSSSYATLLAMAVNGTFQGRVFRRAQSSGTWAGWLAETAVGAGSPEGVVSAPIGTLYTRTDGSASTTLYVKESGTGSTGWVAK